MHRCLQIQEILRDIFGFLGERNVLDYGTEQRNLPIVVSTPHISTLHACAIVCRTFLEPALDELWYEQAGMGNLIRVHPGDLWEDCHNARDVSYLFAHPHGERVLRIVPGHSFGHIDWSRFDYYARRIRILRVTGKICTSPGQRTLDSNISSSIILALRSRGRLILSALQKLEWGLQGIQADSLPCFDVFLGPQLKELAITTSSLNYLCWREAQPMYRNNHVDNLLDLGTISRGSPHLNSLSLCLHSTLALMSILPQVLAPLRHLQFLRLSFNGLPVTADFILALGGLPTLHHLSLTVVVPVQMSDDFRKYIQRADVRDKWLPLIDPKSLPMNPVELSHLEEIELCGENGLNLSALLACVRLPVLRRLLFCVDKKFHLSSLFAAISTCQASNTLTSLETATRHFTVSGETFTLPELRFLKTLPNLKNLVLKKVVFTDLTDNTIEDLACDFPHLESLALSTTFTLVCPPKVTIRGVAALAKGCPRLRQFDIPFDAMNVQEDVHPSFQNTATRVVGNAIIGGSLRSGKLPDLKTIALQRLKRIFPNLEPGDVKWTLIR